jgi:hypothetical protein
MEGWKSEIGMVARLFEALVTYIPSFRVQLHSSVFLIKVTVVSDDRTSKDATNTSVIYR